MFATVCTKRFSVDCVVNILHSVADSLIAMRLVSPFFLYFLANVIYFIDFKHSMYQFCLLFWLNVFRFKCILRCLNCRMRSLWDIMYGMWRFYYRCLYTDKVPEKMDCIEAVWFGIPEFLHWRIARSALFLSGKHFPAKACLTAYSIWSLPFVRIPVHVSGSDWNCRREFPLPLVSDNVAY